MLLIGNYSRKKYASASRSRAFSGGASMIEMTSLQYEQLFRAGQRVINGELAGRRHHRIKASGGDMHRDAKPPRRRRRVEITQRIQNPTRLDMPLPPLPPAADAGQRQSEV